MFALCQQRTVSGLAANDVQGPRMIDDPFLNYFALGILFFVVVVLFYGVIAIHDIPHIIAKADMDCCSAYVG
jgi:hypothetical protein